MTDPLDALRRRGDREQPVPDAADARIRTRYRAALQRPDEDDIIQAGDLITESDTVVLLERPPNEDRPTRRSGARLLAAAAAVLLVGAAIVLTQSSDSGDGPGDRDAATSPGDPMVVFDITASTRWTYDPVAAPGGDPLVSPGFVLKVDALGSPGSPTPVRLRNDLAGVFGFTELVINDDGSVELPPALLDPARNLVDCRVEAGITVSIDLVGSGEPVCDDRLGATSVSAGPPSTIELIDRSVTARPVTVTWTPPGEDLQRTTLWVSSPDGVVRIDRDNQPTHLLRERTP